jgi:hypothetical protein
MLSAGTYDDSNVEPGYGAEYLVGTTGAYVMCSNQCDDASGGSVSAQGSFTLVISDPGSSFSANGGVLWLEPSGTLSVKMPAQVGGAESGTVTVHVTF